MVTFAKNIVEIREYQIDHNYRQEKKEINRSIKKRMKLDITRAIKRLLYRALPSEEEYVVNKTNQKKRRIRFIQGFIDNEFYKKLLVYVDLETGHKVKYSILENDLGMVNISIKFKGFPGQQKYKKTINTKSFSDDIFKFKAEYHAKKFVINTIRKVFEENNIM